MPYVMFYKKQFLYLSREDIKSALIKIPRDEAAAAAGSFRHCSCRQ